MFRVCVDRMVEPDDSSPSSPGCAQSPTVLMHHGGERSPRQKTSCKIVLFVIILCAILLLFNSRGVDYGDPGQESPTEFYQGRGRINPFPRSIRMSHQNLSLWFWLSVRVLSLIFV
jgi:hypothetical protein